MSQAFTESEFEAYLDEALSPEDMAAVEEAKASGKVTVHDWPAEERAKFRSIAVGEWEKSASASEASQKVYDTLVGYLKDNGLLN